MRLLATLPKLLKRHKQRLFFKVCPRTIERQSENPIAAPPPSPGFSPERHRLFARALLPQCVKSEWA